MLRIQPTKISTRTRASSVAPRRVSNLSISRKFSDITDTMRTKEDSAEKAYVLKHEEEVLNKLKAALMEEQRKGNHSHHHEESRDAPVYITMEDFLDFKKDITNKLRDLEDEIHAMKMEKYKKRF